MEKGELPDEKSKETVSSLIQRLLEKAINLNASDIHLELQKDFLRVRFRIDGVLQEMGKLSKELSPQIFSRMKILGDMDIAVQRQPQDGHYSYLAKNHSHFDLRISTIPAQKGEKMVLRLLDQIPVTHNLEALGFFEEDLSVLKNACRAASRMVIMVGPTGSGKTTTLYAMLNLINSPSRNILTIENPVEYELPGITQISIDPDQDLDFSKTLRAALRQDPDVILIGETRDPETAESSMDAAETGHLVFTTLHANSSTSSLTRLLDMEVPKYKLNSSVRGVLAQRLLRKVCPGCAIKRPISDSDAIEFNIKKNTPIMYANTLSADEKSQRKSENTLCQKCLGAGYKGRVGAYELLLLDRKIQNAISKGLTDREIEVLAVNENSMLTLTDYGIELVKDQLTTISEVIRVCKSD